MQAARPLAALSGAPVRVPVGPGLYGELVVPPAPVGPTVFAPGGGSSRLSPRNRLTGPTPLGDVQLVDPVRP